MNSRRRPASPILWLGRIVFGSVTGLGIYMFVRDKDAAGLMAALGAFAVFLLTFVRRAF